MSISKEEYGDLTKKLSPKSPLLKDCLWAFISGGLICAVAEGLFLIFSKNGLDEKNSRTVAMICIVAVTAFLTAVGVFDVIAKHAGAGTAVPISGFANSIVSAALEFQADERDIIGLSRKAP